MMGPMMNGPYGDRDVDVLLLLFLDSYYCRCCPADRADCRNRQCRQKELSD
jgi:hypothetical protein